MTVATTTITKILTGPMILATTQITSTILQVLNNGRTLAVGAYFIGTTIVSWCTLKNGNARPLSKWRKISLIGLRLSVSLGYAAQGVACIPWLSSVPDDFLTHKIAQLLLWLSLVLILVGATSPMPLVWIGTAGLNLLLDTIIDGLTLSNDTLTPFLVSAQVLQTLVLVMLAILTTLTIVLLVDRKTLEVGEGTQAMLAKGTSSSSSSIIVSAIETIFTYIFEEDEGDADSDSDDDDDEAIRASQRQRLAESGGWLGYLRAFKIFLPDVLSVNDLKLQMYLVAMVALTIAQRTLNVLHPRQHGIIIDKLSHEGRVPWLDMGLWLLYQVAASDSGIQGLTAYIQNRLEQSSLQKLTIASVEHVMSLSMDFHDNEDSAEVIKAINQANSLHEMPTIVMLDIGTALIDILVASWYVTHLFDIYAMFILITMGIGFVFSTYHLAMMATSVKRVLSQKERDQSKLTYESVGNWFTISCFNQPSYFMSTVSRAVRGTAKASLRSEDLYVYMFAGHDSFEKLGQAGITILGASRVVRGLSTMGDLVALQSYWQITMMPLWILIHEYRNLNSSLLGAERLLQLFTETPSIRDSPTATVASSTNPNGDITFTNVSFSYPNRSPTLTNLNFTTHPGQTIALVGSTGSGKSTILKLLMRFYDTTSGTISLSNQPIDTLTLTSLRSLIGFVPQDPILFNTTILHNIRFGQITATTSEINAAARAAYIHDRIPSLPQGYNTLVGERGVKLSGGERQRIALARVILKDAPIVLLDEATSAMESATEARIQDAVRRLRSGRTMFVIAHRLSTVVDADVILVLEGGEVVERGSHTELGVKGGRYAELWAKHALVFA